jgi:hypothetical protein
MKKQKVIIKVVILIQLACLWANAQDVQSSKEISEYRIRNDMYTNVVEPAVFADSAVVYARPDATSKVLRVLTFNTSVNLLGKAEVVEKKVVEKTLAYSRTIWYKVELVYENGYVKGKELATHTFSDPAGKFLYFFITANGCSLHKYDINSKQWVDSLTIEHFRGDRIQQVNTAGWKNTDGLFRATRINAFCGGGVKNEFIIDANGKLSVLISTASYIDDGSADAYSSVIWLPQQVNKKTILIANGDLENVFDTWSWKLNTYPVPKNIPVPLPELVVFKETKVKSIFDKSGEPLLNPDGSFKSKTTDKINYFRWNGMKLVRIK